MLRPAILLSLLVFLPALLAPIEGAVLDDLELSAHAVPPEDDVADAIRDLLEQHRGLLPARGRVEPLHGILDPERHDLLLHFVGRARVVRVAAVEDDAGGARGR